MSGRHAGSCACGAVRFTAEVVGDHILACHCGLCRALNAGPFLSVEVRDLRFEDDGAVAVYRSSERASRPYCPRCGSTIAWCDAAGRETGVGAFLFDPPLDLAVRREVYTDDKPAGYAFLGVPVQQAGGDFSAASEDV